MEFPFKMLACLFLLSLFISSSVSAPSQKSVSVSLDSKWKNTPLHLEASEFLSEESSDLFWKFIEEIVKLGPDFIPQLSDKQQYEVAIEISSHLLSPAKLALLKFSLALRAYSPAVELFHQIAHARQLPSDCEAVVEVGNQFACDIEKLEEILKSASQKSDVYKVDHKYHSLSTSPVVAVLYGEIGTASFITFHRILSEKASQNQLEYALRHYVWKRPDTKVRLSGYGVELAIKSTEYKAQDDTQVKEESGQQEDGEKTDEVEGFLFHKLRELHPDKTEQLDQFKAHVLDSTKELDTLKVWELQELSLQAAQHIITSAREEALRVMRDVSQNFPIMAKSLVQVTVTPELKREVERNQQMFAQYHNLGPSDAALFLNGLYFDVDVTDMFTLLQILKQETSMLEGLSRIGIMDEMIPKLMKLDLSEDKQDFAVDIRDTSILYMNDIENDKMYRTWPGSLQDMLRVTYPGMLRNVRKNIYHLVIVADPSSSETRDIFKLAESFYVHKAPLRIGIVFAVNNNNSVDGFNDAGVAILNAYNFISQDKTPYEGLSFITDVYAGVGDKQITAKDVIKQFETRYRNEDLSMIFGAESDYDVGRKLAWDFINRTGIGAPPQVLINGVILKKNQLNVDLFEEAVLSEIMRQTPFIQKSIYKGDLTDNQRVIDFLMSQSNVMPRLNKRILTPGSSYIDFTGHVVEDVSVEDHSSLSVHDSAATFESSIHYLTRSDKSTFHPFTVWVIADYETETGQELLLNALMYLKSSNDIRLGIIHNPVEKNLGSNMLALAIQAATESLEPAEARVFITKLLKPVNLAAMKRSEKTAADFLPMEVNADAYVAKLKQKTNDFLHLHSNICERLLKISPGKRAVMLNGRVIGPFHDGESFGEDDFSLLEKYSMNVFGEKLSKILKEEERPENSGLLMKATTVLMNYQQTKTRHDLKFHGEKHSVIKIPASDDSEPSHEIVAIVDPVSRGAQKLSSVLLVLQRVANANIKIFLNCVDKHSNMPLKSFYRFVVNHEPEFGSNEQLGPGPIARFNSMPTSPLLTLGMATPENWMVECVKTPYDLDNIHLERVEKTVHAEFELEHLLLEGHCFEQSTGNPPRGLQFTLGTATNPVMVDTIVMANLGYFQLKASPGVWFLKLRHGRSTELYDVVSQEGTDSPSDSPDVVVAISNFRSHVIKIKVNKKQGKQHEELLMDDDDNGGGIWNSIANIPVIGGIVDEWREIWGALASSFSGSREKEDDSNENLNIFSLASGHLYERLLRIMMLSVLKNTKTPVKFWFLKNYLSPTFKDFLPHMAKEYNFEYELVQYKWPRWLNQQTEKQRIIWGYKILFLDVLFPLDVKKFIFVDADQVVRTDMKELRDMDLGGAPYGYTPFCESRSDMDGFRFWKTGYWASHLAGRRYHISALYVVDLKKFRRIAAGDRLRGQYQGLSQDPNSLSNLDQDLPNNMIHQVNIKSLPQEWLWCETWCDDDSKKYAKTIDLCNNPKTKEPKLVAAMRILPEWKGYDTEIKELLEKVEKEKRENTTQHSSTPDSGKPKHPHQEL